MDWMRSLSTGWARFVAALLVAGGLLALVLGFVGASGTAYVAEQIPYVISGAITALFLLGVAATLYLSADMQEEWWKLDDIERRLEESSGATDGTSSDDTAEIRRDTFPSLESATVDA